MSISSESDPDIDENQVDTNTNQPMSQDPDININEQSNSITDSEAIGNQNDIKEKVAWLLSKMDEENQ